MTRLLILIVALLGLAPTALAQTRALPTGEIRSNGDIMFGNTIKLGTRAAGKTVFTPDALQILGPGSTGDISEMSAARAGGGVVRRMKDFLSNEVYAADYGVVPDDGIDDGPALRQALSVATARKATLRLPSGNIDVCVDPSDAEALIRITGYVNVQGSRNTQIVPCATTGSRVVLLIKPPANTTIRGSFVKDLTIIPYLNDAFRIDTTNTNGIVAKLLVENVGTGVPQPGYYALHHINAYTAAAGNVPASGNVTGGLFASTFRGNDFIGGIKFEKTGDSNNILENIISNNNIGIDYEAISGAAMHRIEGNNITSKGGAIRLKNTIQAKIIRNQMEQQFDYTGAANDKAMITLDGSSFTTIEDNNANTHGKVDVINIKFGSYNIIGPNAVTYGDSNVLLRLTGAPSNTLRRQMSDTRFDGGGGFRKLPLVAVDTASAPVGGLFQSLTLDNGFTATTSQFFANGVQAMAANDNTVRLRGSINNGTRTQGTRVAQLPASLIPPMALRIRPQVLTSTGWQQAVMQIDQGGAIRIEQIPTGTDISFDDVSFSVN